MTSTEFDVVTGAFGYTGRYIARRLLAAGRRVVTLTGHPHRPSPFGEAVRALPFSFQDPAALTESLRGAATLYNTYWVRFPYRGVTYQQAVEHSRVLIAAAREAGVRRIVHISITNASEASPFPYFRGKGQVERAVVESGVPYAILRPRVVFGREDILINNIAWLVRRFPVFAVPGSGAYRLQPVYVEDVAELAVEAGAREDDVVLDAVGPETYTFDELVRLIGRTVGRRVRLLHLPPWLALALSRLVGLLVRDVVLTREEMDGLMAELLVSSGLPTGRTLLSQWLQQHADTVGTRYASELARHYR